MLGLSESPTSPIFYMLVRVRECGLCFLGERMFGSLMQDKMPDPALASEPAAAKEAGLSLFAALFPSCPNSWQFGQRLAFEDRATLNRTEWFMSTYATYKSRRHRSCCEL